MNKHVALVLGSTGFIGSNLVKKLVNLKREVISFSRSSSPPLSGVQHITGDFSDLKVIKTLLKTRPSVIYALIGLSGQVNTNSNPEESYKVNVLTYLNFLELVRKNLPTTHLIFSSSRLEYGKPVYLPVDEQHPIQPLSWYGVHKHFISDYCQFIYRLYIQPTTVFRTSNPYGPHKVNGNRRYNVVNFFVDQALNNRQITLFGKGEQVRDYLYIDDLIEAFLAVSQNKTSFGKIYNVGGGDGVSLKQIAQEIVSQTGKGVIRTVPWPQEYKKVETGDYISNIAKISREIGWKPSTTLKVGIQRTITFQNKL